MRCTNPRSSYYPSHVNSDSFFNITLTLNLYPVPDYAEIDQICSLRLQFGGRCDRNGTGVRRENCEEWRMTSGLTKAYLIYRYNIVRSWELSSTNNSSRVWSLLCTITQKITLPYLPSIHTVYEKYKRKVQLYKSRDFVYVLIVSLVLTFILFINESIAPYWKFLLRDWGCRNPCFRLWKL